MRLINITLKFHMESKEAYVGGGERGVLLEIKRSIKNP